MLLARIGRSIVLSASRGGCGRLFQQRQPRRTASYQLPTGNSQELGFYYRHPGIVTRQQMLIMEGCGALIWFYLLYHIYNYPAYVIGHPSYPNPREWSDAELGIPPPE